MMSNWKDITGLDLSSLSKNRKLLHQAVQIVGAFPRNLLPPDPTDATASLVWNSSNHALESIHLTHQDKSIKVGLTFASLQLYVDIDGATESSCSLSGKSVNEGLEWLKSELETLGIDANGLNLKLPYEIENYDYSDALNPDEIALDEFAILYQNTQNVLSKVAANHNEAFDIRCWPHHFDLATLIPLETDKEGEILKSIGVGLSPGDEGVDEPYVYVNVWPQIDLNILEQHSLPIGQWNQEGWAGAVLTYSQMLNSENQKSDYQSFISAAIQILIQESAG